MSGKTSIVWTDKTWNPVVGCTKVSEGCVHCYAYELHQRRYNAWKDGRYPTAPEQYHEPFNKIQLLPQRIEEPFHWRKPCKIFVNSMSDLFHEQVPDEYIELIIEVMEACPQHIFQVLTKRSERMTKFFWKWLEDRQRLFPQNLWLGVTAENQKQAEAHIPLLLQVPASVCWVSIEPLLEPVDLQRWLYSGKDCLWPLDWVVVGGESGSGRRPCDPDWVRQIRDQCLDAKVPFLFKQWGGSTAKAGGRELDGQVWDQYPDK